MSCVVTTVKSNWETMIVAELFHPSTSSYICRLPHLMNRVKGTQCLIAHCHWKILTEVLLGMEHKSR